MAETKGISVHGIGHDLSSFQYDILTILSNEAMYGLAIKRQLKNYYLSEVNHGRLYSNLDHLVEWGLIEKSELDGRTNQYALTEVGYKAVLDHIEWKFSKFLTDDDHTETIRDLVESHQ